MDVDYYCVYGLMEFFNVFFIENYYYYYYTIIIEGLLSPLFVWRSLVE
jgi:hypothetical protein